MISLSIIIPVFNCADTLGRALKSIPVSDNKLKINIIIIDDCSTDDYKNLLSNFSNKNITYYRNQRSLGPGLSRNIGIAKASSKYVCFLDADDEFEKSFFKFIYDIASKNQHLSTIQFNSSDLILNSENGDIQIQERKSIPMPGNLDSNYLVRLFKGEIPCECWQLVYDLEFLRKSKISFKAGYHEDLLYWYLISHLSQNNYFVEKSLYYKYRRMGSIINTLSTKHIKDYFGALTSIIIDFKEKINIDDSREYLIGGILDVLGSRINRINKETVQLLNNKEELNIALWRESEKCLLNLDSNLKDAITNFSHLSRFTDKLLFWYELCYNSRKTQ